MTLGEMCSGGESILPHPRTGLRRQSNIDKSSYLSNSEYSRHLRIFPDCHISHRKSAVAPLAQEIGGVAGRTGKQR